MWVPSPPDFNALDYYVHSVFEEANQLTAVPRTIGRDSQRERKPQSPLWSDQGRQVC